MSRFNVFSANFARQALIGFGLILGFQAMGAEKTISVQLKAGRNVSEKLAVTSNVAVWIHNIRGTTEVLPSPDDNVYVAAFNDSSFPSTQELPRLEIRTDAGRLDIKAIYPQGSSLQNRVSPIPPGDSRLDDPQTANSWSADGIRVEMKISIPRKILQSLKYDSWLGSLNVEGFDRSTPEGAKLHSLEATTSLGSIRFQSVHARHAKIQGMVQRGAVVSDSVFGEAGLSVSLDHGNVSVRRVESRGPVLVKSTHEAIELDDVEVENVIVAKSVRAGVRIRRSTALAAMGAETVHGGITVENSKVLPSSNAPEGFGGTLVAAGNFAQISDSQAENLAIRTRGGAKKIKQVVTSTGAASPVIELSREGSDRLFDQHCNGLLKSI